MTQLSPVSANRSECSVHDAVSTQVCTRRPTSEGIEAAIDAEMRLGKIAVEVLGEAEMVIGPDDGGLGVGDEGVDPAVLLKFAEFLVTDDDRAVGDGSLEA